MLSWGAAQWADWHKKNPNWIRGNPVEGNPFYSKAEIQQAKEGAISRFGLADAGTDRDLDGLAPEPKVQLNSGATNGWEGRSDSSAFKRYVVFEVGGVLEASQFRAWACSDGLAFKSLQGSWKGRHQPSFIAEDTAANRLKLAFWVKGQEALLCLGPAYRLNPATGLNTLFGNREATLDWLEPDGYTVREREPMKGKWSAVAKVTTLSLQGWTFDPTENQYYAVV